MQNFKIYKDGCIWINPSIHLHIDDIDFDFSYTEKLENSNDTKTITHYYSDEQQRQIINFVGHSIFEYFIKNKDALLLDAKNIVGAGNRITSYEN